MTELEPQEPVEVVVEETVWNVPTNRPRTVYAGMWGPAEIGVVAVAGVALLGSLLMYFFFVLPANRELARNRSEADRLEAEVISARSKYGEITSTQDQVTKLVTSVDDFETRFLPAVSNGQSALYQRLNSLIQSYGLINTSGPDYAPLEPIDQNAGQETDSEKGRAKFRSLYPGVYVTTNIEGTYQNLRRFVRDIENGNEFIVISAIELAPSDNEAGKKEKEKAAQNANTATPVVTSPPVSVPPVRGPNGQPAYPPGYQQPGFQNNPYGSQAAAKQKPGKNHGDLVSLHIELAAYFRRPNFAPTYGAAAQ